MDDFTLAFFLSMKKKREIHKLYYPDSASFASRLGTVFDSSFISTSEIASA